MAAKITDGGVFGGVFRTQFIPTGTPVPTDAPVAAKRAKLVATKERWAKEGRGLTGAVAIGKTGRVPPGQSLTKDWPVLDLGHQPAIDRRDVQLRIGGLVDAPGNWDMDAIEAAGIVERVSDIHCVTQWSRLDNHWRGLPAQTLLKAVRVQAGARFVWLRSHDGYATTMPLAHFDRPDVLLATHWEGQPLTREHGGPLRLVVPQLYFWKSAKWLRQIWFAAEDTKGFWEARGYHAIGDPWAEERYG